jgi:hypothetical protein
MKMIEFTHERKDKRPNDAISDINKKQFKNAEKIAE